MSAFPSQKKLYILFLVSLLLLFSLIILDTLSQQYLPYRNAAITLQCTMWGTDCYVIEGKQWQVIIDTELNARGKPRPALLHPSLAVSCVLTQVCCCFIPVPTALPFHDDFPPTHTLPTSLSNPKISQHHSQESLRLLFNTPIYMTSYNHNKINCRQSTHLGMQ